MGNTPTEIFEEYKRSLEYKSTLFKRGMYEQNRMNERFFSGDQWYGTSSTPHRPLVRHNIIKRIGDYKMGMISEIKGEMTFSAEGVNNTEITKNKVKTLKKELAEEKRNTLDDIDAKSRSGLISDMLTSYYKTSAYRLCLEEKLTALLKKSFITGTGILYMYWENGVSNLGDIECEVLNCEDVCFADNTLNDVQKQPFIIIATQKDTVAVKRLAKLYGANKFQLENIKEDYTSSSKTTVLTKFFKEMNGEKTTVKAVTVCEGCVIRSEFDTGLTRYPINVFAWEEKDGCAYGESEINHIIPNQIAINRMITASVWSAMSMGMPIMTVNGDTVVGDITNDPGQIIKVYGSNEDVKGAINFVTPPDFSSNFERNIETLINNTIESCSAAGVLYSLLPSNNSAAVSMAQNTVDISLKSLKNRYKNFLCSVALGWLDFCISKYGKRNICIEDNFGRWYFPFDAEECKNKKFTAYITDKKEIKEKTDDSKNNI